MKQANYEKEDNLKKWHKYLNREDMDHDAESLVKGKNPNTLFIKCRDELFADGFAESYQGEGVHTYLPYSISAIIPKLVGNSKPAIISESKSIRDTEPAYKLNMSEKYTPAYYFDPASRTFPKDFQKDTIKYNGKTINLAKYGLDVEIKIEIIGSILAMTVESKIENFIDKDTTYIHKAGYVVRKVGERFLATKKNDPDVYMLGNKEKDAFFKNNVNDKGKDIITKGKRLILYKLLGDLLHVAFAEDDDLVFTLDTYLRDRSIKSKVSCVVKEKDYIDAIRHTKKNIWTLFYDKVYDINGDSYYPEMNVGGGPTTTKQPTTKQPTTKPYTTTKYSIKNPVNKHKNNDDNLIPLAPTKKFVAEGREGNITYSLSRKNDKEKTPLKRLACSMYHYHSRERNDEMEVVSDDEMEVDSDDKDDSILGGGIQTQSQQGGTHHDDKLKNVKVSLSSLLEFLETDINKRKNTDEENFKKFLKDIEHQEHIDIEHQEHYEEILVLIKDLKNKEEDVIGKSDKFIDLTHLVIDNNILFEGELENFLIKIICKDDELSKDVQEKLNELTENLAIYTYDYRVLTDFKEYFLFEKLKSKINKTEGKYNATKEDIDIYNELNKEQKKSIDTLIENHNFGLNKPNVFGFVPNENSIISVRASGGKPKKTSRKKKKPSKKQTKSKKNKTKRIQIKKHKQTKKKIRK